MKELTWGLSLSVALAVVGMLVSGMAVAQTEEGLITQVAIGNTWFRCVSKSAPSAVCPEVNGYENGPGSGKIHVTARSNAFADYGFLSVAAVADASPCAPMVDCDEPAAVPVSDYVNFIDGVKVIDGPATGWIVVTYLYQSAVSIDCFGGQDGVPDFCHGKPVITIQGAARTRVKHLFNDYFPFTADVSNHFGPSLYARSLCGADEFTSCYSSFSFSLSLIQMRILDERGALVSGASLVADSGTNYNEIVVDSDQGTGQIVEPSLVHATVPYATELALLGGVRIGTVSTATNPTVPAGHIISQSPVAGTQQPRDSTVSVVVSDGAHVSIAPNVVYQPVQAATNAIINAGLTAGTVTAMSSDTIASGIVIRQSPDPGTTVATPSPVDLVVSSGSP